MGVDHHDALRLLLNLKLRGRSQLAGKCLLSCQHAKVKHLSGIAYQLCPCSPVLCSVQYKHQIYTLGCHHEHDAAIKLYQSLKAALESSRQAEHDLTFQNFIWIPFESTQIWIDSAALVEFHPALVRPMTPWGKTLE